MNRYFWTGGDQYHLFRSLEVILEQNLWRIFRANSKKNHNFRVNYRKNITTYQILLKIGNEFGMYSRVQTTDVIKKNNFFFLDTKRFVKTRHWCFYSSHNFMYTTTTVNNNRTTRTKATKQNSTRKKRYNTKQKKRTLTKRKDYSEFIVNLS